jgi:hypothetical protein
MRSAKQAVALLSLTFAYAAFGQTGGTITGLILDPQGAVVPNAPVEAKNTETGVVAPAATSATGNYVLAVPAGTYEISVSLPGFKKYIRTGIPVQQLQTTRIDIALEVGGSTESVTVNADAPLLKTESGDISHNVTTEQVNSLPMGQIGAIRVTTQAVLTIPGVNGTLTSISVNGSPAASERIRIDGMDATYTLGNTYYSFGAPSVDSVQEVAIQTSNYAAEFGQSTGAVLSYTMRSGTNQYHGSAYDYWANEAFNSFGAYSHTRNKSRINDYGGTIGGPIWIPKVYNGKNRTFFFFSYESRPTTTSNSNNLITVPTAAYRTGNFSAAAAATGNKVLATDPLGRSIIQNTIYDPLSQRPVSATDSRLIRDPFPNNTIPLTQIDKVALKVQAMIPQPQGPLSNGLFQNFLNPYQTQAEDFIPSLKIDHSINSKAKLSGTWGWVHIATPGPPTNPTAEGLPTLISVLAPTNWNTVNYRVNYDQTIAPTLLLHLGAAYVDSKLDMPTPTCCYDNAAGLGLTGPFVPQAFPAFANMLGANNTGGINVIGPAPGLGLGFNGTQNTNESKTNIVANMTWVRNNHTFKWGGEADIEGYPNYNIINTNGLFRYSANQTALPYLNTTQVTAAGTIGLPYASFLLGLPDSYEVDSPAVARLGKHQLGFYVQDTWKVSRKLTLEIGLRYDYSTAGKEQYGRYNNFDPRVANTQDGGRLGGVTYGATCGCDNNFFNSYKLGLGPRLGVAYQIDAKTVLRGGAALLIGTTADNGIQTRSVTSVNNVPSTAFAQSPLPGGLQGGIPLTYAQIAWPNFNPSNFPVVAIPGTPGAAPPVWIDRNAGYPSKSYQYSFGIQREIIRNLLVDVAYVGNRGVWLPSGTAPFSAVNYNANTPQSLLAAGLDITQASARAILSAPIGSTAAGPFQNKLPYAGFPLTATVAQALRPYPQFTTSPTPLWAPLGDNWYNSLQLRVIKRVSHGLDMGYNFTWSKTLTNGIEGQENDIYNRGTNKFLSNLDRPLVSNIYVNYTVPSAPWVHNKVLNYVLRDWTAGALFTYASGAPILVPTSTNNLNTSYFLPTSSYMNRVPGVALFLQDPNCHCFDPTKALVLNPAAWTPSAAGTYGVSPAYYNDYRYQRHPTENFNVGRTFRIRERMNLSIRGEFVNIFNRTVLPNPSAGNATGAPAPQTAATCYLSGTSGATGACNPGATFASGFGFIQTANIVGGTRTGQIVARFQF